MAYRSLASCNIRWEERDKELVLFAAGMDQVSSEMMTMEESLKEVRETYLSGKTKGAAWRRSQLKGLLKLIIENERDISKALQQDLGKHPVESYRDELGVIERSLTYTLKHLSKWMAPKKVELPLLVFPTTGKVVAEPLGVVLIFSCWNFPFELTLDPVVGAIAAGNSVVIKPSELSPSSSSLIAKLIPMYLDPKAVKVIEGGPDVAQKLLDYQWDKIFFTGGSHVGRLIMSAAVKHLTPVTLELGGKCPAVLDSLKNPVDLKVAVKRIISGKWGTCNGQACVAVDYLLVEEEIASTLIDLLKNLIKKCYGEVPKESNTIARIVNKHHVMRLQKLLEEPAVADSIVHGGSSDADKLSFEPTILLNPPLDSEVMNEEIFGPILPIITLKKIEDSIHFIKSRPQPLAIYVFTKDNKFKKRMVDETSSGSVVFNDTIVQCLVDEFPFGGVGQSGFGRYHGKFSFDTFSHEKGVLKRPFLEFFFRHPPWNNQKLEILKAAYSLSYFKIMLLFLGIKKSSKFT